MAAGVGMSYELSLIKSEYVGGPLDGDKRRADAYAEYYAAADVNDAHRYYLTDGGMHYSGLVERTIDISPLRPLTVGLER